MKFLNVFLKLSPSQKILVGTLAEDRQKIRFQYDSQFLKNPVWLSPYKLPPQPGMFEHKDREFGPIFGLFDNSLPDGWGLLLMDRYLRKKGIDVDTLTVLDRLSFLGASTMGALIYEPSSGEDCFNRLIDLQEMYRHSVKIIESDSTDIIPVLMKMGGSPQGARPKIQVGVKDGKLMTGADDLPEGYEHWLIKFPSPKDFKDAGKVEKAYALMAEDAGIMMPTTRLFEVESGDSFFGIKRFDRNGNQRFHVHSLGGLIHSNFRIPGCDYQIFLRVISDLTQKQEDVERGFRQMVFNIMGNNRDDHVKNFSFLIDADGEWTLSPAYDLIYSPGPGGEHSMSVSGEGRSPGLDQVKALGLEIGLKPQKIQDIIDQSAEAVRYWESYADELNISQESMNSIRIKINENLKRFQL